MALFKLTQRTLVNIYISGFSVHFDALYMAFSANQIESRNWPMKKRRLEPISLIGENFVWNDFHEYLDNFQFFTSKILKILSCEIFGWSENIKTDAILNCERSRIVIMIIVDFIFGFSFYKLLIFSDLSLSRIFYQFLKVRFLKNYTLY